jgi:hypothetical protein
LVPSFEPRAILDGAFGVGLRRNVIALQVRVPQHRGADDKLFGFGFRRCVFTIRIVRIRILWEFAHASRLSLARRAFCSVQILRCSAFVAKKSQTNGTKIFPSVCFCLTKSRASCSGHATILRSASFHQTKFASRTLSK